MNVRSYVGASIELYNVSGSSLYVTGVYNKYTDGVGSATSNPVEMSTDTDAQNAVSKLHGLNSGMMVRLVCKRLTIGNMFNDYTGGGVEIIYWDVEAGATGLSSNQFDNDFLNDM
jgi:hypothetical protein